MIVFTAATWIFAILGGFVGFVMLIVDIVAKRLNILWMPITSMVLGIVSLIMSAIAY